MRTMRLSSMKPLGDVLLEEGSEGDSLSSDEGEPQGDGAAQQRRDTSSWLGGRRSVKRSGSSGHCGYEPPPLMFGGVEDEQPAADGGSNSSSSSSPSSPSSPSNPSNRIRDNSASAARKSNSRRTRFNIDNDETYAVFG